jgi:hypothetical protein
MSSSHHLFNLPAGIFCANSYILASLVAYSYCSLSASFYLRLNEYYACEFHYSVMDYATFCYWGWTVCFYDDLLLAFTVRALLVVIALVSLFWSYFIDLLRSTIIYFRTSITLNTSDVTLSLIPTSILSSLASRGSYNNSPLNCNILSSTTFVLSKFTVLSSNSDHSRT